MIVLQRRFYAISAIISRTARSIPTSAEREMIL
jgi:hypothetical protein